MSKAQSRNQKLFNGHIQQAVVKAIKNQKTLYIATILVGLLSGGLPAFTASDVNNSPVNDTIVTAPAAPKYDVTGSFKAVVTQYSAADSCHNPDKNGKCIMASGRAVYVGAVACPNFLALGTKIKINGTVYTCEDRYAQWLDRVRTNPTIDVFVSANPHGKSTQTIEVLRSDTA